MENDAHRELHHEELLTADNLTVHFINTFTTALKDVSLTARGGEIICVIGPNGAGKTTLLGLLAGSIFRTTNRIKVFGLDRWKDNFAIRKWSVYVPADGLCRAGETPRQHLQAMGLLYDMDQETFATRCAELVNELHFAPYLDHPWETLSLGLTHKALLIGGFLPNVEMRILDEPVASGIDVLGMEILGVWMKEARARGELVIFSTQVLDRANLLADRLLVLDKGKVKFLGAADDLVKQVGLDPRSDYSLNEAFTRMFGGDHGHS